MKPLQIDLNPREVVAPVLLAIRDSSQVVSFALEALERADLREPPMPPIAEAPHLSLRCADNITSEDRRNAYRNWLLARGFQDLAKGVRLSLERANIYICVVRLGPQTTLGLFQQRVRAVSQDMRRMKFPVLIGQVSSCLKEPLAFESEFVSLQKIRNCMEHRGGRVSHDDVDPMTSELVLTLPRLKFFYEYRGEEIELRRGEVVRGDGEEVAIHM
jgi:hypothetical protein